MLNHLQVRQWIAYADGVEVEVVRKYGAESNHDCVTSYVPELLWAKPDIIPAMAMYEGTVRHHSWMASAWRINTVDVSSVSQSEEIRSVSRESNNWIQLFSRHIQDAKGTRESQGNNEGYKQIIAFQEVNDTALKSVRNQIALLSDEVFHRMNDYKVMLGDVNIYIGAEEYVTAHDVAVRQSAELNKITAEIAKLHRMSMQAKMMASISDYYNKLLELHALYWSFPSMEVMVEAQFHMRFRSIPDMVNTARVVSSTITVPWDLYANIGISS